MLRLVLNDPSDRQIALAQEAVGILARLSREYGKIWDDPDEFTWAGNGDTLYPMQVKAVLESATRNSGWHVEFNRDDKCIDIRVPVDTPIFSVAKTYATW